MTVPLQTGRMTSRWRRVADAGALFAVLAAVMFVSLGFDAVRSGTVLTPAQNLPLRIEENAEYDIAFRESAASARDRAATLSFHRAASISAEVTDILDRGPVRRGANLGSADKALVSALTTIERHAAQVQDPEQREFFSDRAQAMFLLSAEVELGRGRPLAALWYSDRARQVALRTLRDREPVVTISPPADEALGESFLRNLPPGATVIHQDLRADELLTWVIRNDEVHFVRTPVSAASLTREIEAFVGDLRRGPAKKQAYDLYRKVLFPVGSLLEGAMLLVYSPGPALRGLPLGALHDGQQLVAERCAVVVTQSIGYLSAAFLDMITRRGTRTVTTHIRAHTLPIWSERNVGYGGRFRGAAASLNHDAARASHRPASGPGDVTHIGPEPVREAVSSADRDFVRALIEIERHAAHVLDPVQRASVSDRARAMLLRTADAQLGNGRPLATLWFSDRARQVAIRTFGNQERAVASAAPPDEGLGQSLLRNVPAGVAVVHQDLQADELLTWVVRDGDVHFVRTPVSAGSLTREVEAFVSALGDRQSGEVVHQARNLYQKMLGPVRNRLEGATLLIYSPAPALRGLPIGALHDGHQFVVERWPVAVTRSLGLLSTASFDSTAGRGTALVTLAAAGAGAPLPGARYEAAAIATIHGARSTSLLGADATSDSFLRMVPDYDLIHIGSHGRVDRLPLQNAMEFGEVGVRAYDVTRLRLSRHPIVVLAGCRTDDESGRATLSLANAFIAAGASAVVGTLWDIDDRTTATLMVELHRHLARGVSAAEALRIAQRTALERNIPISTWAAFQVQM